MLPGRSGFQLTLAEGVQTRTGCPGWSGVSVAGCRRWASLAMPSPHTTWVEWNELGGGQVLWAWASRKMLRLGNGGRTPRKGRVRLSTCLPALPWALWSQPGTDEWLGAQLGRTSPYSGPSVRKTQGAGPRGLIPQGRGLSWSPPTLHLWCWVPGW